MIHSKRDKSTLAVRCSRIKGIGVLEILKRTAKRGTKIKFGGHALKVFLPKRYQYSNENKTLFPVPSYFLHLGILKGTTKSSPLWTV